MLIYMRDVSPGGRPWLPRKQEDEVPAAADAALIPQLEALLENGGAGPPESGWESRDAGWRELLAAVAALLATPDWVPRKESGQSVKRSESFYHYYESSMSTIVFFAHLVSVSNSFRMHVRFVRQSIA